MTKDRKIYGIDISKSVFDVYCVIHRTYSIGE